MRKIYTLLVAIIFFALQTVVGQTNIASYSFASSVGTYTPITGTAIWTGTWDSEISAALPLGGTFTYGGVSFTTCYVSANGWLAFGTAAPTSSTTPLSSAAGSPGGVISAFANDGANSTATGAAPLVSYANIGGANGEFVVQFRDHARWSNSSTERLNFQIRLNLSTGAINVVYGSFTPAGSTAVSSQVGIRGNSTTFATNINNLMIANVPAGTSCNWTNATTGFSSSSTMTYSTANANITVPNGLTYTWTPQSAVAPVRTFAAVSAITSSGATISWTAPTGASQYNVQYRALGTCAWTNVSAVSSPTVTLSGLNPTTVYQVRVQATNGSNTAIWSHIPNQVGTGDGVATTGTFTTTGIATDLQALQLQTPVTNASNCYLSNAPITVRIKNAGTAALDFSANNATVSAAVTGTNAATFSVVLSTGTLAAGATQDVVVAPSYNMFAAGTYTINASAVLATPDANPTNNAIAPVTFNTAAPATLPQLVNFNGYTGTPASLNTAFPGWTEGSGTAPVLAGDGSFTNTSSTAQLSFFGAAAKMNLYDATTGWLISPRFVPTANHKFKYKASVVNYNTSTAANFGANDTVRAMVSVNCGASWTTLREFTLANNQGLDNSTNALRSFEDDLSAYAGQTIMVAIYAKRAANLSPDIDIVIDDVAIDLTTTCFEPTSFVSSALTNSSATIDWAPPTTGSPANYQVYYNTTGTAPTAATAPTVLNLTAAQVNLSSLTASTKYYLWVRSNCGSTDGVSVWAGPITFTTLCNAVPSFTENFDAVTTPALPSCWSKVGAGGTVNTQGSSANSTPNTLYIYSTSTSSIALVTLPPVSTLDAGTYRLRFKGRANVTVGGVIEVGYMTDPSDANTFNLIESKTMSALTYQDYTVMPPAISGAQVLAFRHTGSPANSVLIDDVAWELIPTCDAPTAVIASNVTINGVQLDWTPPTTGSPSTYEVYYNTANTAPTAATTPTVPNIAGTSTNLSGLASNTTYYVWVRSNCGGSGTSVWSSVTSFTTQCDATNVPYTVDFESVTVPAIPVCTVRENAGTGNNWATVSNPGSGFTTKTLRYNYNLTNAANAWFFTQGLNLTAGTSYRLVFKYGTSSTTYTEKLEVKFGTDANSSAMNDLIVDYPSLKLGASAVSTTEFTPAATGVYYIGFHAYSAANQDNLYVDDISVTVTPTCDAPTAVTASNITQTAADLNWVAPTVSSPSSYDVYYNTTGTAPTSATAPILTGITATTANLTPLASNTLYYVWVRSSCSGTDKSAWSAVTTFTTLCGAVNVPYTQNFESATVPGLPGCTSRENAGTGNNWVTISSPGYGFTDNTLRYAYNLTNAANAWFYTQGVNLTAGTSYRLTFKYGTNSTTYTEKLEVKFGISPASADMANMIVDYPSLKLAGSAISTTDFMPSVSGVYYIGFHAYSASNQDNLYVDDIALAVSPTCLEPTAVNATAIATNSLQLNWTPPAVGTPSSYEVYYNTASTAPTGSTTPNLTGITATQVAVPSLNAGTSYYFFVRTRCSTTDASAWTPAYAATTACAMDSSFSFNFDGLTTPALPNCWYKVGTGGSVSTQNTSAYSGSNTLYIYSSSTTSLAVVALPPVNNLSYGTHELRLMGRANFTVGGVLEVGYLTNPLDASTFVAIQPLTMPSITTYTSFVVDPGVLPAGVTVLAFRHTGNPANSILVDDVSWTAKSILPVSLVNFKGERVANKNVLSWTTATEINNAGFELQRGVDGRNFTSLAYVASKAVNGNSTANLSYGFDDVKPLSGNGYYRLKQIDKDGKASFSQVVLIKGGKLNAITIASIYPNPVAETLNMVLASPTNETITLVVTDLSGKVVKQQTAKVAIGDNQLQVQVSNLASGTYLVKAMCANGCETAVQKFVKD